MSLQLNVTNVRVRDLGMWLRFVKVKNAAQDAEVNMNTENVHGVNTVAIVAGPIVQGSVAARSGKRLKKLKFVKVTEGLTYVEAIMRVRREDQQKEQKDSDKTMIKPCDNHCRMNDKTMVVEKIIHAFMAEVINCSAQTDSRSERIRIIIRAAGNLKIEGIAVTMWDWWILMVFILLQWIARSLIGNGQEFID